VDRETVFYQDLVNSKGPIESQAMESSDIFRQFYVAAAIGCKYNQDPKSCQTLANLCVMQLYNERTNVCRLLKTIPYAPKIYLP